MNVIEMKVTIENLREENQSLKKENKILRENAEHNDKVVDKVNWENQLLKKQLEEYKHKSLYNTCLPYSTGYKKAIKEKVNQQKEFIEYLAKQSELYKKDMENINYIKEPFKWEEYNDIAHEYKVILQKYKEIIGVSNENNK